MPIIVYNIKYVDNKDYVFNENVSFIYNELNVLQKLSMLWEVL